MKKLVSLLTGVVLGLSALTLLGSACYECDPVPVMPTGTFVPDASEKEAEADYKLVVASDYKTVTESFTRDGKKIEIVYDVTAREPNE